MSLISFFTDVLKALPENANLRLKLGDVEKRAIESEAREASLKDDLRHANAKIAELGQEITSLEETINVLEHGKHSLKEPQIEILKMAANTSVQQPLTQSLVRSKLNLHSQEAEYHLERLVEIGYLRSAKQPPYFIVHHLTHAGREYLVTNGLLAL